MAHDVFICHSTDDRTIANAVCARLEEQGIRCWIAPRDVAAGPYGRQLVDAVDAAQIFVLVFSGNTNKSEHVLRELEIASDRSKTIIPFRTEDVKPSGELEYFIRRVHWLDALTPPLDARLDELVHMIRRIIPEAEKPAAVEPAVAPPAAKPTRLKVSSNSAATGVARGTVIAYTYETLAGQADGEQIELVDAHNVATTVPQFDRTHGETSVSGSIQVPDDARPGVALRLRVTTWNEDGDPVWGLSQPFTIAGAPVAAPPPIVVPPVPPPPVPPPPAPAAAASPPAANMIAVYALAGVAVIAVIAAALAFALRPRPVPVALATPAPVSTARPAAHVAPRPPAHKVTPKPVVAAKPATPKPSTPKSAAAAPTPRVVYVERPPAPKVVSAPPARKAPPPLNEAMRNRLLGTWKAKWGTVFTYAADGRTSNNAGHSGTWTWDGGQNYTVVYSPGGTGNVWKLALAADGTSYIITNETGPAEDNRVSKIDAAAAAAPAPPAAPAAPVAAAPRRLNSPPSGYQDTPNHGVFANGTGCTNSVQHLGVYNDWSVPVYFDLAIQNRPTAGQANYNLAVKVGRVHLQSGETSTFSATFAACSDYVNWWINNIRFTPDDSGPVAIP